MEDAQAPVTIHLTGEALAIALGNAIPRLGLPSGSPLRDVLLRTQASPALTRISRVDCTVAEARTLAEFFDRAIQQISADALRERTAVRVCQGAHRAVLFALRRSRSSRRTPRPRPS